MTDQIWKKIRSLLAILLWYTGVAKMYRFVSNWLFGNPVTILCAHKIVEASRGNSNLGQMYLEMGELEVTDLEIKLKFLKEKYRIISLDDYIEECDKADRLPKNCVVLTFDDGYKEHYTRVYPLLKRLNIPGTFFITTDYISNNDCKWDDKIATMIAATKLKKFELDTNAIREKAFDVSTIDEKARTVSYLLKALKYVPEAIRSDFVQELGETLKLDDTDERQAGPVVMSWEDLETMPNDPLVSIGAHSCTHPVLSKISDTQIRYELLRSKEEIEKKIGKPVELFSYPFGKLGDFDERVKRCVRDSGFRAACTFCYGRNRRGIDPFALRRIPLLPEPLVVFKVRMSCIFDFISRRREKTHYVNPQIVYLKTMGE